MRRVLFATIGSLLLTAGAGVKPALAADLGGDCCADLEERVAELEATTVRKGNRKVSLTLSGQVNRALLFWDDGGESNVYSVDNDNDVSQFRFEGDAEINKTWKAGFLLELDVSSALSSAVTQIDDDGGVQGDGSLAISDMSMWLEHARLGKVTWGFTAQGSDGAPEVDLSGTEIVAYSAINDVAGGFFVRRSDVPGSAGLLTNLMLGSFMDNLNGDSFDIIRYDSPTFAGFTFVTTWGEDDRWDVALWYEKEWNSVEVAGAIAYSETTDEEPAAQFVATETDFNTLAGSISLLHRPSGLNFTFAAGWREFENTFQANNGVLTTRADDQSFYYVKGGLLRPFNSLGNTGIYGEYGDFDNFLSNDADAATVDALDIDGAAACAAAGVGCLVSGSDGKVWGFGIVQHIDAAHAQLYAGYRHYEMSAAVVDVAGANVPVVNLEDFDTVMVGGRIEF